MLLATYEQIDNSQNINPDYLMRRLLVEEGVSESVLSIFRQLVPTSFNLFNSLLPNLKALGEQQTEHKPVISDSDYRKTVHEVQKYNFVIYSDTLVMVPEGFEGNLHDYLDSLCTMGRDIGGQALKLLQAYSTELAMFLSTRDIRTALKSQQAYYKKVADETKAKQTIIAGFFNPKASSRSRYPLGKLMHRWTELGDIYLDAETLASVRKSINYHAVQEEVKRCADLLKLIKTRVESRDVDEISAEVAKNLATGAYEVARYVEQVALFGYYSEVALASVNVIHEKLKELFKL